MGSLWYEHVYDPTAFRLLQGSLYLPVPNPVSAIPEFFGDTMLINGLVHPYLNVEPKKYRFLMLNACNARFLNLNLLKSHGRIRRGCNQPIVTPAPPIPNPGPAMVQLGTEGGYLAAMLYHPNTRFFDPEARYGGTCCSPPQNDRIS